MECPSCYEYFDGDSRVPRNLNCGHTFCEMCLVKIEQQRLTFCPICRTGLQKPFKARKLPKNYLALEYANKQQEMMKKSNFCQVHTKELMRHFCITCVSLICMECIVDHSGHEFVRKEESIYILKENGDNIVKNLEKLGQRTEYLMNQGYDLSKEVKRRKFKTMQQIDDYFEKVVKQVLLKKAEIKLKYSEALKVEEARINREQENFEKHMSLVHFCKENVGKLAQEIDHFRGKQIKGSDVANRLENFKRQEDELQLQTEKLSQITMSYPLIEYSPAKLDSAIKNVATVHHRTVKMTAKKLCFFGDTNKVIILDLHSETWVIKTINKPNYEFLYYAAAVTLPNGDALITGGGSSTTVFQFITQKSDLVQKKSMNQMRKEHAAVICENSVFVMGGYDGVQNVFLNCCEVYNVKKDEWRFFSPMNISKCAFSATVVNNKFIYTFGGYDGQNRLDAIERYSIVENDWLLLKIKLKFPLSNCACFCPEADKVVVFGGGFSSGFSPYVEQIDIKTGQWKTMPIMNEGRDLRNKVCFVDNNAYAVGGLNSKAERFTYKEKKWVAISEYPLSDNLDSWACALTYTPQEYANLQVPKQISVPSGIPEEAKEIDSLLEQERLIDNEIKQELAKYKMTKQMGIYMDEDVREAGSFGSSDEGQQDEEDAQQLEEDKYLCEGDEEEENEGSERINALLSANANVNNQASIAGPRNRQSFERSTRQQVRREQASGAAATSNSSNYARQTDPTSSANAASNTRVSNSVTQEERPAAVSNPAAQAQAVSANASRPRNSVISSASQASTNQRKVQ